LPAKATAATRTPWRRAGGRNTQCHTSGYAGPSSPPPSTVRPPVPHARFPPSASAVNAAAEGSGGPHDRAGAGGIRGDAAGGRETAGSFSDGVFPETAKARGGEDVERHALCTWWDVLAAMRASEWTDADRLDDVHSFLRDPISWSAAHGGHGTETV